MIKGFKIILIICCFYSHTVTATTATTTFQVTATVTGTCTINSASSVAFGSIDPTLNTSTAQTSTISMTCTNGTAYTIALDKGLGTGASDTNPRFMKGQNNSALTLSYGLYKDASHQQAWGNAGAGMVSVTGSGVAQPQTIYGQVPAQTSAQPDSYSDTITMTVTY